MIPSPKILVYEKSICRWVHSRRWSLFTGFPLFINVIKWDLEKEFILVGDHTSEVIHNMLWVNFHIKSWPQRVFQKFPGVYTDKERLGKWDYIRTWSHFRGFPLYIVITWDLNGEFIIGSVCILEVFIFLLFTVCSMYLDGQRM